MNPPPRAPCPCCGYLTLSSDAGGSFELCPVCYWEDDAVQLSDPEYAGGANAVSLSEARRSFSACGASDARFREKVRRPTPEEYPRSLLN